MASKLCKWVFQVSMLTQMPACFWLCFWSQPTHAGTFWRIILLYVQQLVVCFICQLFCARQLEKKQSYESSEIPLNCTTMKPTVFDWLRHTLIAFVGRVGWLKILVHTVPLVMSVFLFWCGSLWSVVYPVNIPTSSPSPTVCCCSSWCYSSHFWWAFVLFRFD